MKVITKEQREIDFDNFLMQKVEDVRFIDNNLELKLVDRDKLIFRDIKIYFADLHIFNFDNLYFYNIKVEKIEKIVNMHLIFENNEKLYELKINLL